MPAREISSPFLRPEQAYAHRMSVYPALKPWETQIAVMAGKQGLRLSDLARLTPFRQYLGVEQRAPAGKSNFWHGSFSRLFADTKEIGHFVSFGNFAAIRGAGEEYGATYHRAGLDIEEFFQDALYFLVPSLLMGFDATKGSFLNYVRGALVNDLESRVNVLLHRSSTLPIGQHAERVPAKRQANRLPIDRLDRFIMEGEEDTLGSLIADSEGSEPFDSFHRVAAIQALYTLAGLRPEEAEAFTLLEVNGEGQRKVASRLGVTDRTLRYRRDRAMAALHQFSREEVQAILAGDVDQLLTPA